MEFVELRDPAQARQFLLQGFRVQRTTRHTSASIRLALEWCFEVASGGHALPPTGFIADLGGIAFGIESGQRERPTGNIPEWPHALIRNYEDHVLGKLYADWTFERATDALRRYSGRDRVKGLAYVVKQIRERTGFGGVELAPSIIRTLLKLTNVQLLAEVHESLNQEGSLALLQSHVEQLIQAFRKSAEVLAVEDLIALEQRTALSDMGQYVAHRQILTTTARIEAELPTRPVRPLVGRKEVPTRIHDEDQYPVGGYSSIATRGSVESLLHSQLAYMEPHESPDLFDVKFIRDELFYYARDENQFLRRRRTFVFAFFPDLTTARFKDPELPVQRIVLALSSVLALIRKFTEWLSTDALTFEVLFVHSDSGPVEVEPLAQEAELLRLLLREPIERNAASVRTMSNPAALAAHCTQHARSSQLQALFIASRPTNIAIAGGVQTELLIDGARPRLTDGYEIEQEIASDDAWEYWIQAVETILKLWL